jgi:hypothetical protein
MNRCPKCGNDMPEQAAFCPACGAGGANPSRWVKVGPLLVGLLILGAAAMALYRAGLLKLPGSSEPALAAAGHAGPTAVLPGEEGHTLSQPGSAEPTTQKPGGMPAEIRAWLDHLKRIDRKREQLNTELASEATALIGTLQPGVYAETEAERAGRDDEKRRNTAETFMEKVDQRFRDLTAEFHSLPPPEECRRIAAQYTDALLGTREMTLALLEALQARSIQQAAALESKSYSRIDQPVDNANKLIDALCQKYGEPNVWQLYVERSSALGSGMGAAAAMEGYAKMLENVDKWANEEGGGD